MSHTQRIVQAQTFTPYYSTLEDRIRFVINYSEYEKRVDFWLTRSFLLKLLPTVEEVMFRHTENAMQDTAGGAAQNSQNPTDGGTLAVTEKEGELIHSVDITYHADSKAYQLTFKGEKTHATTLLDEATLKALMHSLTKAAPALEWGITPHWF